MNNHQIIKINHLKLLKCIETIFISNIFKINHLKLLKCIETIFISNIFK